MQRVAQVMDMLVNSEQPLSIKQRMKNNKPYEDCFSGKALVDWLLIYCNFIDRVEALRLAELMFSYRYIICIEDTTRPTFAFDSTLYILQTPQYWATEDLDVHDIDYCAMLLRRANPECTKIHKAPLSKDEAARLDKLQISMRKLDVAEKTAATQIPLFKDITQTA